MKDIDKIALIVSQLVEKEHQYNMIMENLDNEKIAAIMLILKTQFNTDESKVYKKGGNVK